MWGSQVFSDELKCNINLKRVILRIPGKKGNVRHKKYMKNHEDKILWMICWEKNGILTWMHIRYGGHNGDEAENIGWR